MLYLILWLIFCFLLVAFGGAFLKGLGLILGIIGIIVFIASLVIKKLKHMPCPKCSETIKKKALVCKHCGSPLNTETT